MTKNNIPTYLSHIGAFMVSSPILAWWAEFTLITPAPFYYFYQQVSTYFIDSMAVFTGNTYSFIDHPGTPISVLGTVFLALTYPFVSDGDFILYHLSHPLIFHRISTTFIALLFVIGALNFYKKSLMIFVKMSWLVSVTLPLIYFFLHSKSVLTITLWEHNAFAYPLGTSLLVFMVLLTKENKPLKNKHILLHGFLMGILTAIQFYFIAWLTSSLIVVLVYYKLNKESVVTTLKTMILLVISVVAGFLFSVLPIIKKLPTFIHWIADIVISEHRYAAGAHRFTSWPMIVNNFQLLIRQQPFLFQVAVILGIGFLFLVFKLRRDRPSYAGLMAMGMGLVFQIFSLTLMFILEPGQFYTLSIAATLPVLVLVILKLLETEVNKLQKKIMNDLYAFVLIFLFVYSGAQTMISVGITVEKYRKNIAIRNNLNVNVSQFISDYALARGKREQDLIIVYTPELSNECVALLFGRTYAHLQIDTQLSQICPNQYYMDEWRKAVIVDDKPYFLKEINWDLLFVGKSYLYLELAGLTKKEILHEVSPGYFVVENNR